jgi:hypothetical protein
VHGGVDLRLTTKTHPSHRRVPSDEAILRMAAQQRVRNLDPRLLISTASAPLPDMTAPLPSAAPTPATVVTPPLPDSVPQLEQPPPPAAESEEAKPIVERIPTGESAADRKQAEASAVFGER